MVHHRLTTLIDDLDNVRVDGTALDVLGVIGAALVDDGLTMPEAMQHLFAIHARLADRGLIVRQVNAAVVSGLVATLDP